MTVGPRRNSFLGDSFFIGPLAEDDHVVWTWPPEPRPPKPPRPEPQRVVCPACLRKIALRHDNGKLCRHGPEGLGRSPGGYRIYHYGRGETNCPGYDVWRWTEEGVPQPVTGEARAWLPFLKLMAARRFEQRNVTIAWDDTPINDDSTVVWSRTDDALRAWRVAERNKWDRGIPFDFCPEERE